MASLALHPVVEAGEEPVPTDVGLLARVDPSIVVPRLTYETGQGIAFQIVLSNPSRLSVEVPESCLAGSTLTLEQVGQEKGSAASGRFEDGKGFTLAPGAIRRIDVDMTRKFKLREIGRYRVFWECGAWQTPRYDFFLSARYDREQDRIAVVTTDLGTFEMVLMPEQAPEHVRSFVELARAGFYDGALIQRVIPGVQADIPGAGSFATSGPAQQLAPEIDPAIRPGKGLVGAMRALTSVTSASGFFILLDFQPGFKGLHTFFAYVRSGMEVLDAIGGVEIDGDSGPSAFHPKKDIAIRRIEIKAP